MSQMWSAFYRSTKNLSKRRVKAMKREAKVLKVCAGICFGIFFVTMAIPLVVVGWIENPLLTSEWVIGIALVVGALLFNWNHFRADDLNRAFNDSVVFADEVDFSNRIVLANNPVFANPAVPVKILPPSEDGAAGGAVGAGACVPRPPGGKPPTLKAEAALPLPTFHLRAVSLSIRHETPRQA